MSLQTPGGMGNGALPNGPSYRAHRLPNRNELRNLKELSALRSHEAMGMLRTQEVMMQVSYPLSATNRHIQIFYAIFDVR